ncbi:MAG: heme o synthase [Euryarchaeota archaeon]|nr:heme o synthase [Euryarchaeota archaeon]MDE1835797.1 heme o synthase [Euryarchaeota archaeon]MDE1880729.1 heme o synthase [Euryarchaeota archaeon]MDE2043988.1 heme o synthase [Thermoplasmata archaeon]
MKAEPSLPLWRAYLSLLKPGITGLILLMVVAGFFAAEPPYPPPWIPWERLLGLLIAGAFASGGAGALNHWYDRDLDVRMKRTRSRPIPLEVIPARHVLVLGLVFTAISIPIAYLLVNLLATLAMVSGSFVYVVVYTILLKRRSRWNIVIGGYAGSAPVLGGCAAAVGTFTPSALLLALLVFLWTPPHFWSLAIALREDFGRTELPMLPVPGDPVGSARVVVASAGLLLAPTLAFLLLGHPFLPFLVLGTVLGLVFVAMTWPVLRDPSKKVALRGFIASGFYLIGIALAMIVDWSWLRLPFHP